MTARAVTSILTFTWPSGACAISDKPDWYLPTWYNSTTDKFRLEQNMSFMEGIQGMATPPWFNIFDPQGKPEAQGVVECNKTDARLGTIFTAMPVNRGQVAVLYSLDQCIDAQIKSGMKDNYEGGDHTRAKLLQVFTAMRMLHTSLFPDRGRGYPGRHAGRER